MKMKAATVRRYGPPETIQIEEVNAPIPKSDEVRVAIRASCATAASSMMRAGTPRFARLFLGLRGPKFPIPGSGFAGVVESIGVDVTEFKVGDEVFGETAATFGTNAEYVCLSQSALILHKPAGLRFEEAAPMCDGSLTSYNFLVALADLKKGQEVMIIGASGALGSAGIQIAKAKGAIVTAICSAKNIDFVKSLGADHVIDYNVTDYRKSGGYNVIYDSVGASSFSACADALTQRGKYLSPVLSIGLLFAMMFNRNPNQRQAIFSATGLQKHEVLIPFMKELVSMVEAGDLTVPISQTFPLDRIVDAHKLISTGHKRGNLAIVM
jgi:NADPH:quinone reductase-like Zn-dependent oxidoreductase